MQSVERPTLIELFSTFFDRVSCNHPQRDTMIKDLYQFKSLLYVEDPQSITNFIDGLQQKQRQYQEKQYQEKSPLRGMNREGSNQRTGNSQNKLNSQRKDIHDKENIKRQDLTLARQSDENFDLIKHRLQNQPEVRSLNSKTPTSRLIKNNIINNNSNVLNVSSLRQENSEDGSTNNLLYSQSGTQRITRFNSKKNVIITVCNHEIDKETFSLYVNSRVKEQTYVDCPVCSTQLPLSDYSAYIQINPLDDFKQKNSLLFKSIQNIQKSDESIIKILQSLGQGEESIFSKQRQVSTGNDLLLKNLHQGPSSFQMNGNSRIVSQESEFNQKLKKCLRCSKTVEGGSYFCQACKSF